MNGDEWDGSRWFVLDCWIVGFLGGRKGGVDEGRDVVLDGGGS